MRLIYGPVHVRFLRKHIRGRSYRELAPLFNKRFGLSATCAAVKTLCTRNRLRNGFGARVHGEYKTVCSQVP